MDFSNTNPNSSKLVISVSISESLIDQASELQINLSEAAEAGVTKAISDKRAALWLLENSQAIDSWNSYVDRNGLPLAKYRSF
jgi:antitoxin CcdA